LRIENKNPKFQRFSFGGESTKVLTTSFISIYI
jgi:hypothetical protein